jgi:hypothetical protein
MKTKNTLNVVLGIAIEILYALSIIFSGLVIAATLSFK